MKYIIPALYLRLILNLLDWFRYRFDICKPPCFTWTLNRYRLFVCIIIFFCDGIDWWFLPLPPLSSLFL